MTIDKDIIVSRVSRLWWDRLLCRFFGHIHEYQTWRHYVRKPTRHKYLFSHEGECSRCGVTTNWYFVPSVSKG